MDGQEANVSMAADALIRSLIALPELAMRVSWLHERIAVAKPGMLAPAIDQIALRSQLTDSKAREAMLAIAVLLARLRDSSWIWALREEAKLHAFLNLERLLRQPHSAEPLPIESEPQVPDYGTGRPLSVGERRTLARRPTRTQLERLLLDPHPLVIEQLLRCPSLTEDDVISIATRRPAHVPSLDLLLGTSRWISRRRVRMSLTLNPGTPHGLALPFLMTFPREDLHLVFTTTTTSTVIRTVAHELYQRLPPLKEPPAELH